jgi:4-hydroxymandelate oxidase
MRKSRVTKQIPGAGERIVTESELEVRAREQLPPEVYAYYAGAAGKGATLAANCAAFSRLLLRPRVLNGVVQADASTSVFGVRLALPVAVAPMALQALAHPDGEVATTRAAEAAGTAMILSIMASTRLEDAAAAGPLWFQLYVLRDRGATRALVDRAVAAGVRALVVTVDAPPHSHRRPGVVSGFSLPRGARLPNLDGLPAPAPGMPLSEYFATVVDGAITWTDIAWLRSCSRLPLVLKGIVAPEDARLAAEHGVDAVVVSNHGGRVLDGAIATLDALPEVVRAAADRVEVWMDGGVRHGTDVFKALALGARVVLIGRPVLWSLATGGEAGVRAFLAGVRNELEATMVACGCAATRDVTAQHVAPRRDDG